ncbi:hypothetical protein BLA60_08460 [Actinophytocola xinjiangensis]|uniref:Peptidase S8/S53 domain-containing protein n=1 Tax=Actinophytocola xinjiangensis TaxID=485602 RepID=A0A7Z1AZ04_9PSEU|nr:hypothetical protein BLA60_08460 [Actinophytocola xinjiangensis]
MASAAPRQSDSHDAARPNGTTVTLVTGDQVTLHADQRISVTPGSDRDDMTFSRSKVGDHVYVIPGDARQLVATGHLDRRLFDVTTLVEFGYDDAHTDSVPLIVTGADGAGAPRLAGNSRPLPSIDGVALAAAKNGATWEALTDGVGVRTATRGVNRIWLDGKREAVLDRSAAQIGAPAAWEAGLTGEGVRVAVLDTGVDQTHPDLAGQEVAEQNFSASPDAVDNYGHGTHVASILAGTGAKAGGKYRGIASGADILDGKVLDDYGFGSDSEIIAGMEWAAAQDADIISMSLGGADTPGLDPMEQAVETLTAEHDVLFVIAAGNGFSNDEPVASPGSAPSALTVGAVDRDDSLAPFSLTGPTVGDGAVKPDLTAPGVEIVAALHSAGTIAPPVEDGYTALSGTSMATPHVAGVAAMIAQQHPDWTAQQLKAALAGSATPTDGLTAFQQGSGRVDVPRAMTASVVAEPSSVSLGVQTWPREDDQPVTRPVTYRNLGDADVTLALTLEATDPNGDPTDAFSLSVDQLTVPAGGTASVEVTGDPRTGPADGAYSGTIVATAGDSVTRTPVGISREEESYDLTVTFRDDPAVAADAYVVSAMGLDEFSIIDGFSEDGTVTMRLPKGRYLMEYLSFTNDNSNSTQLIQPGLLLDRNQAFEVDLASASPVDVTPPGGAELGIAEIAYQVDNDGQAFGSGFLIFGDELDGVRFGQLGDPLPELAFDAWVHTGWQDAQNELYSLAWFLDRYPTDFTKVVGPDDVATLRVDIGPSAQAPSGSLFRSPQPASGSLWTAALGQDVSLPGVSTLHVTTEDIRWATSLWIFGETDLVASYDGSPLPYDSGRTYDQRINHPVFGPGLPAGDYQWAYRGADEISVDLPLFTDGAGNAGFTPTESGSTKLYLGDELVGETPLAGRGFFSVPAQAGDYRLTTEATRSADYGLSTSVGAEWTFRSSHVDGEEPLPLNVVRFQPKLDADGSAPAGRAALVPVRMQNELGALEYPKALTVDVSYDEGKTWRKAAVLVRQVAVLEHPAGASSVSLRASATDQDGNTVTQTVIRAYTLK